MSKRKPWASAEGDRLTGDVILCLVVRRRACICRACCVWVLMRYMHLAISLAANKPPRRIVVVVVPAHIPPAISHSVGLAEVINQPIHAPTRVHQGAAHRFTWQNKQAEQMHPGLGGVARRVRVCVCVCVWERRAG